MRKLDPCYIDNIRRHYLRKLSGGKLTLEIFSLSWQRETVGTFWVGYADQVEPELEVMRPETLGKIASFALADNEVDSVNFRRLSINELNLFEQLPGWDRSGQGILADIAAAVILSAIYELLQVKYIEVDFLNQGLNDGVFSDETFKAAGERWLSKAS